ncbi:MAG: SDR family oxidoreductase, partial [Rhodoglobus sp.]
MTVVIAGCGDLGTETGLRFAALGHRVIGLRRTADRLPKPIEGQAVDLSVQVPTLPSDTTIVMIAMSPDERSTTGYRTAYVDTVRTIATAIMRDCAQPPRVLYVSSTAVYGVDDGSWVDEATVADPTADTARVLLEAEQTLHELMPDATILRLGGIYGPGRTRQIDRIRDGIETMPSTQRFTNLIHRDDAASAIVHLTTMPQQPHRVYIGVDDCPSDQRDIIRFLANTVGVAVPPIAGAPVGAAGGASGG